LPPQVAILRTFASRGNLAPSLARPVRCGRDKFFENTAELLNLLGLYLNGAALFWNDVSRLPCYIYASVLVTTSDVLLARSGHACRFESCKMEDVFLKREDLVLPIFQSRMLINASSHLRDKHEPIKSSLYIHFSFSRNAQMGWSSQNSAFPTKVPH
jgi:hypothetical protein